ncbi:MAG: Ig-like domain-containing protein [Firmicutes bacterium]|nr:Ig-like domain-containing protein [Bacillota bacterium]
MIDIDTVTAVPPSVSKLSTPKKATLYAGNTYEIAASVLPANSLADQYRLNWTSSNESVAKVEWISDIKAKITGVSVGTAVITVASPNGRVKYTCKVTVNEPPEMTAINLDKSEIYLELGDTSSIKGSAVPAESLTENRYLQYYSTNTSIATVDALGNIKAVGVGTAEIVCASDDYSIKSPCKVQVFTPAPPTTSMTLSGEKEVYSSEIITLTAAPVPAESVNPIKAITWKSSDESIARVEAADKMSLTGSVKGVSIGSATITAVSANGVEATYQVTVNVKEPAPEYVTPKEESVFVPAGGKRKVDATVYPETAADRNLHWGSADESIATVDKDGYVTGVATGVTKIMAYACNNVYAEIEVEVIKGGLVYLSPSRQADNAYAVGATTEYEQMYKVAYAAKYYLEEAGFEVHIASYDLTITERDEDAASRNAVCYVAIHSNAANKSKRGTLALYYSKLEESMTLADSVCSSVGALTPNNDEGIRHNDKYIEVAHPAKYGIPATLVEVDYHDSKSGAKWIINNTNALGKSVADGIIAWMRTR